VARLVDGEAVPSASGTHRVPAPVTAACPVSLRATLDFDTFFTRYEQALYGYLRRMLPSDEVAMEIAQEAFFRSWTHFTELQAYDRPEAWLYRVATNLAISHLRRHRPLSFSQVFKRSNDDESAADSTPEQDLIADPLDVERQTADRDLIDRVLRRLPERQRAALLLRAVYGHSCEEVATALGITLPNARQTLSRGRDKFRRLYAQAISDDASAAQAARK
jgi:RNA polymerase sigma-70 factor (ECF subfamily)